MGIRVSVYTNKEYPADCTLNGISNRHHGLTVVNIDGPFEPDEQWPAVLLVKGNLENTAKIVPLEEHKAGKRGMMGGNYASTCDSRFSNALKKLTGVHISIAPIHDRFES